MKRSQFPNRFDFHNDYAFDDEVEAMSANELASITDVNRLLFFHQQVTVPQCNDESSMINGFNESRTELLVDVDCRSNGLMDHSFDLGRDRLWSFTPGVPFLLVYLFFVFFVFFVVHVRVFVFSWLHFSE
jgi:hypothetical protein